jgi:hypothetical protein
MITLPRHVLTPAQWDAYVTHHPWGWFWHTSHWIDYCLAYHPGAEDHSFALTDGAGEIRAVVPLVREGDAFTMGGHPGADPLVVCERAGEVVQRHVAAVAHLTGVRRWAVRSSPVSSVTPRYPNTGWTDRSWTTTVLDLTQPEAALWRGVRRSYHALIHKAERQHTILAASAAWAVEVAHRIHAQASGRETRAPRTWDLMAEWAEAGRVTVALALQENSSPSSARGMALVIRFKDAAYYASGATLEDGLSHALIWHLVTTLQCGGVREFEVGWRARPGDTDKDRSIAFFKEGFGGAAYHVVSLEREF